MYEDGGADMLLDEYIQSYVRCIPPIIEEKAPIKIFGMSIIAFIFSALVGIWALKKATGH
jgi:hypothetical protein